jgi:hypothetical protein
LALALVLAACASVPKYAGPAGSEPPARGAVLRGTNVDPALAARILALDPDRVSDSDVRNVLAKGPTPRIMNMHGGIFPVQYLMESFARFLMRMGYPGDLIHDPGDGALSRSPYESSVRQAGEVAWIYEHEGMAPMLIGHSQGGMQVVKVLYQLAGGLDKPINVFNPVTNTTESRDTIVDPLTGVTRPVIGVTVDYASAVAAGGAATLLPNQWQMANRTYRIPDSVRDFTGFALGLDLVAWDGPASTHRYQSTGTANVTNVRLPSSYSHVFVVDTSNLGKDEAARAWINAWTPALRGQDPPAPFDVPNILWAADVWHSVKQHWVLEAQALLRAKAALPAN